MRSTSTATLSQTGSEESSTLNRKSLAGKKESWSIKPLQSVQVFGKHAGSLVCIRKSKTGPKCRCNITERSSVTECNRIHLFTFAVRFEYAVI